MILKNNIVPCKLHGHIDLINDIEILSETWSNCKKCKYITIENYELSKIIDPLKKAKGRKSGSLHIYCKLHIKPYLKVTETSNSYVWLYQIDKS